jgi:putative transposase
VKEVRKRLNKGVVPKEAVGKANPIVPRPVAYVVWASLKTLKAGGKRPAVLVLAAPMTLAGGAYEGGTRAPPRPKGTPAL